MHDQRDRLIQETFGPAWTRGLLAWNGDGDVAQMPLDVYQTDKEYVLRATLPGVKAEDVEVSVVGRSVTLKAKAQEEKDVKEGNWLLRENRYTSFARCINLPTEVQADKVDAALDSGVLTLKLPKAEAAIPKAIPVKTVINR